MDRWMDGQTCGMDGWTEKKVRKTGWMDRCAEAGWMDSWIAAWIDSRRNAKLSNGNLLSFRCLSVATESMSSVSSNWSLSSVSFVGSDSSFECVGTTSYLKNNIRESDKRDTRTTAKVTHVVGREALVDCCKQARGITALFCCNKDEVTAAGFVFLRLLAFLALAVEALLLTMPKCFFCLTMVSRTRFSSALSVCDSASSRGCCVIRL